MTIDNRIFLIIGILITGIVTYIYKEEIFLLLIPLIIIIKTKFIYYLSIIITKSKGFIFLSKTKITVYLKALTIYKTLIIGIKRFIIDNYFSKWLSENVINPIKEPISNYVKFFLKLGFKTKVKRIMYFILPLSVIMLLIQMTGLLESVFIYAELKALVIGFFKIVWIVFGKIGTIFFTGLLSILKNTWLASIIEIFALSWLLSKLEKIPVVGKYIIKTVNYISKITSDFFAIFIKLYDKYIYSHISLKLRNKMENIGDKIIIFLENTKHENEIFLIKNFKRDYIDNQNFENYYKKIIKEKKENKKEIYNEINKKTKDNIDINYYIDIDNKTIENDILILESVASCNETGNNNSIINKNSFWVFNMTNETIKIKSKKGYFLQKELKSKKIKLIHSLKQDFKDIEVIIKNQKYYFKKV